MIQILALNTMTATRAAIIGIRTKSNFVGGVKSMMIESLKEKNALWSGAFCFYQEKRSST